MPNCKPQHTKFVYRFCQTQKSFICCVFFVVELLSSLLLKYLFSMSVDAPEKNEYPRASSKKKHQTIMGIVRKIEYIIWARFKLTQ